MAALGVEEVCELVTRPRCRVVEDRKCETQYLRQYEETCPPSQPGDGLCHQEENCRYVEKEVCNTHYETLQVGDISVKVSYLSFCGRRRFALLSTTRSVRLSTASSAGRRRRRTVRRVRRSAGLRMTS